MVEAFYTKCVGSSEEYRLECGDTMRKKRMIVTGAVVFLTIAGVLCGKKLFAGKDTSDHKGTKTSGIYSSGNKYSRLTSTVMLSGSVST